MSAADALSPLHRPALAFSARLLHARAAARERQLWGMEVASGRSGPLAREVLADLVDVLELCGALDKLLWPDTPVFRRLLATLLAAEAPIRDLVDQDLTGCWVSNARPRAV